MISKDIIAYNYLHGRRFPDLKNYGEEKMLNGITQNMHTIKMSVMNFNTQNRTIRIGL